MLLPAPANHPFRLLAFSPGPHFALEDDLAAIGFDNDLVRVYLSVAPEGFLNLALNVVRFDARFDFDQVDDAFDPLQWANGRFRCLLLVLPLDFAFKRNPPVFDDCLDLFIGNRKVVLDRSCGIARDVGIWPLVNAWYANLDVIRDRNDTGNALCCTFGLIFVSVAANKSRQRDSAIMRRYSNIGGI